MATISKFYLLDATSPNTGTMPSGAFFANILGAGTSATGSRTARDATDVKGTANPDTESGVTAEATSANVQRLEHRRFVSRPLAATTFAAADGNWTHSYARSESNTNHNGQIYCYIYPWRPSTGLEVGTTVVSMAGTVISATAETADSVTGTWSATQAILDGDILVFEIVTQFTQSMATAYTDQYAYNGTTEASTTSCASFVTPPTALTLFTAPVPVNPLPVHLPLMS